MFTIYYSDVTGVPSNCNYPHKKKVIDEDSLKEAISRDYVCAEYKNSYRNNDNFVGSDCLPVDCDNDHSDNPDEWITPNEIKEAFPDVSFAIHYSRSNNKEKNGKSARPKFHVLFPIDYESDASKYKEIKQKVSSLYPYFDTNALDSARFFFGTKETNVEIHKGSMNLTEYLNSDLFEAIEMKKMPEGFVIKEGSRNSTLSHFAGRVIKKYGDTEKAYEVFMEKAALCDPPLDDEELVSIWNSAKKFYKKLSSQEGYVDPEQYNQDFNLEPLDYSDVGQATVLAREYEGKLKYSPSTDFLVYNGSYWEESRSKAQAISQELTTRQLEEAEIGIKKLTDVMFKNGAWDILASVGPKKAVALFNEEQARVYKEYEDVVAYRKYAIKRRDSKYIFASLKEVSPMVEIKQDRLDSDEFLLNTPTATYDLRFGFNKKHEHSSEDYITKQTTIDPSDDGKEIWTSALNTFFCNDQDLISYVQEVAGLAAIGKVHLEGLIIAYGGGRNGKSTFWNTISKILGSYSGNMSADTLTVGCKRNVKPEMAEIKGKRLVIAAEMEEGMRFNTSNIKQLCSTDEIYAEKKYKEPFKFEPTHTLVLYTNHLPKVGAIDEGTWRRLIVIPFNAKIEGSSDIKNYADYLYENAGGAILKWIMEGSKRVIDKGYRLTKPTVVNDAIKKYKENNNWFSQFLEECCEIDKSYSEKSGDVYSSYREYCMRVGDYTRSTTDFYTALEGAGFNRHKTKNATMILGLKLKSEFLEN